MTLLAGEERRGGGGGLRCVPVEKTVILPAVAEALKRRAAAAAKAGSPGSALRCVWAAVPGGAAVVPARWRLGQADGDGRLDLLREVKVVPGEVGEQRVDEMQAAQMVAVLSFLRSSEMR